MRIRETVMIIAENVMKFLKGEMTWAQVEGLTDDQVTRFMQMGVHHLASGQLHEAQRVFECLVGVNPKDADAHALLGTALQAQERFDEAIAAFDRALQLQPKHVVALSHRGELRRRSGDAAGLGDLKRAAELDPMGRTAAGKRAAQLVRAMTFKPATAR
jgi:Flp pilus assembly protein TadD